MIDLSATRVPLELPPNRKIFVLPLKIQPEHIDENGHVNNVVYVGWLQEVGTAHWVSLFDDSLRSKWSWVALRHEMDYMRPIAPESTGIVARTWIQDFRGALASRCVRIEDEKGNLCAQGVTIWCLVDSVKMRPHRIPQEMIVSFQSQEHLAMMGKG